MDVKEIIPSLYEIRTYESRFWDLDIVDCDLYDLICTIMEFHSTDDVEYLQLISIETLSDLLKAKKSANSSELLKLNFIQYVFSTEIAKIYGNIGLFSDCYDWLIYTITDEIKYQTEIDFQIQRIPEFLRSSDNFIALNAIPSTLEWAHILFYYSRHRGGLIEFSLTAHGFMSKIVLSLFTGEISSNISTIQLIKTTSQMLAWTINYYPELTKPLAEALANYFDTTINEIEQKLIAFQLGLGGFAFTNKSSSDWLKIVIDKFSDLLTGHERMQVLAKYYSNNIEHLSDNWEQLSEAIDTYISSCKGLNTILIKYEKSRLFSVINGLIIVCIQKGFLDIVSNIIAKFYEIDSVKRFTELQLYVICNYNYGVLYASQQGIMNFDRKTPEIFLKVISQGNRYLSTTISLNDYPNFELNQPERPGVPLINEGIEFEAALNTHYEFANLSGINFKKIDSMIIIPGLQHPLQSMMIKELGVTIPISVSFEKSNPRREVKKVLLWCFGTRTSELEIALTKKMFESRGIVVDAIDILKTSKNDFILKYISPDYDLIWVGSHGNYDHFSPHLSKIDLHPDGETELSELIDLIPDVDKQRMLFLNICDGATAASINSVYNIGIGASLCNRNQAVLSHIWMVGIESSFIYGVLYAHFIIMGDDFYNAYENVVKSFLNGKDHIKQLLAPYVNIENELKYYLDKLNNEVHSNIYYWGSGVYYQ